MEPAVQPTRVGIVGLGLIGGSFARAYHAAGVEVYAFDTDPDTLDAAKVDVVSGDLDDSIIPTCELIVLATYPSACIDWLAQHAGTLGAASDQREMTGPVVIDTGGVKQAICEAVFPIAEKYGFYFVGAHPMAGTQFSGYAHSKANLFEGAPLVLVPPLMSDTEKLEILGRIRECVRPLGFTKFTVTTPEEHDRVIAFTSQLAHVVSNAYVKSPTAQQHRGFSAGSYRDLTRVAHLNPGMWSELMMDDADALSFEIDHIVGALTAYSDALKERDANRLEELLAEGDRIKRALDDAATNE